MGFLKWHFHNNVVLSEWRENARRLFQEIARAQFRKSSQNFIDNNCIIPATYAIIKRGYVVHYF